MPELIFCYLIELKPQSLQLASHSSSFNETQPQTHHYIWLWGDNVNFS